MDVGYIEPLQRAYERMKRSLFRPFDFGKWIVIGFAAWLSLIGQSGGGTSGFRNTYRGDPGEAIGRVLDRVREWLENPWIVAGIVAAVLIILILMTVFAWIRGRGRFILLDAVVFDRAAIVEPWRRFRELGNSVFWWRVGFGCVVLAAWLPGLIALLLAFDVTRLWIDQGSFRFGPVQVVVLVGFVLYAIVLGIATLAVHLLFEHFVVPLMYRDGMRATAAWAKFMPLLRRHPAAFVGFMLLWIFLWIVVAVAIVIVGCATCCLGFLVLMIPYVWAVALLPILFTARGYGAEFLSQFGPEYTIFPERLGQAPPQ